MCLNADYLFMGIFELLRLLLPVTERNLFYDEDQDLSGALSIACLTFWVETEMTYLNSITSLCLWKTG